MNDKIDIGSVDRADRRIAYRRGRKMIGLKQVLSASHNQSANVIADSFAICISRKNT